MGTPTRFIFGARLLAMKGRRVSFREALVSEVAVVQRLEDSELHELFYHKRDYRRLRCERKLEGLALACSKKDELEVLTSATKPRQRKLYQAPARSTNRPSKT